MAYGIARCVSAVNTLRFKFLCLFERIRNTLNMVGVAKHYWSKLNQPYSNLYVKFYVFNRDLDVLANGYD